MTRVLVLLSALSCWFPLAALAQTEVRLVGRVDGGGYKVGPLDARLGQVVDVTVQVSQKGGRFESLPGGAKVRWLRVIPRMQHQVLPTRVEGLALYSNSQMFGSRHGRWMGVDTLEYDTLDLGPGPGVEIDGARMRVSHVPPHSHGHVGSAWFAAQVAFPDGQVVRTPDGTTVDPLGITPAVMRVSFRADDSFLGWLGTYFGVPYVFGSLGPQTDRYTGTDCADALVGARRASGVRGASYTSVVGLAASAQPVTPLLVLDAAGTVRDPEGSPVSVSWGDAARPGTLLLMDFLDDANRDLPRAWDHAAVLVQDGSSEGRANGVLDGTDLVRHMTTHGMVDAPLGHLGLIRYRLWRWRE